MTVADGILAGAVLDEQTLIEFVRTRRWFGAKAQEVTHARVLDGAVLRDEPPLLVHALAEIRFHTGTHELYQLLLGVRPAGEQCPDHVIVQGAGWMVYDALGDPALATELVDLMRNERSFEAGDGTLEFHATGAVELTGLPLPRAAGVEQSNTSVVFGEDVILKAYRRLEAGVNPELEVLQFLTDRRFPHIAALAGWYGYSGAVMDLTLGVVQEFVVGGRDGWELALAEIERDPDTFLARLRRLGEVTAAMHTALASDPSNPDFAPEEPSAEAIPLLVATVDEEIDEIFVNLPEHEALEPIAGRGEEVREILRQISHVGYIGRAIRTHGDYHLGQVLARGDDWVVLDFEGEPARSLPERRRKRSPLRDVAGMLRSFAYAASASELTRGVRTPDGWEQRAREEFLAGYFETVDRSIVPPPGDGRHRLLSVFELEKAVYELRYELNNRPDWLRIPVAGIARLLEAGP